MNELYGLEMIDLYKNPNFKKKLAKKNFEKSDGNESCGDKLKIELFVNDKGLIIDAGYSGSGCVISQVSAEILLENIIGKELKIVKSWESDFFLNLLKIPISVSRTKCAFLSFEIIKKI